MAGWEIGGMMAAAVVVGWEPKMEGESKLSSSLSRSKLVMFAAALFRGMDL